MTMQSIRLLETQTPPNSRNGSSALPNGKKYEPWNDIQFTENGGVASSSITGIMSLSAGANDTATIAPWVTDDTDPTQPPPPPKRTLFSSSKTSISKGSNNLSPNQSGNGLTRERGGSEASTSYALAANGVNGTPFYIGTDFENAWRLPSSSTTTLLPRQGSYDPQSAASIHSNDKLEVKDGKKSLRDRSREFGRLLKKKASKVGLAKMEASDDGHTAQPIPPLPYPYSSPSINGSSTTSFGFTPSTSQPNPPSPTAPKEKKRKGLVKIMHRDKDRDHGIGFHSSDMLQGDPEITLDTNLDSMEGIVDLRHIRSLNDFRSPYHNIAASTDQWDIDHQGGSSFGTSDGGGNLISPSHLATAFTDPWAAGPDPSGRHGEGHSRSLSGGPPISPTSSTKRRSHPPAPLALGGHLPKATRSHAAGPGLSDPGHRDPAWHAPESWDVDKVGPEAPDYSSDDEIGGKAGDASAANLTIREDDELRDFGIIDSGPQILTPTNGSIQPVQTNKTRSKVSSNPFNPIGMIGQIGGGSYGIGVVGYGRSRTKSDAYSYMGLPSSRDGTRPDASTGARKDSWPDNDDPMSRRPSEALSSSTTIPKTPLPSFHLRVYRIDGTYHIVECPVNTIAQDLSHVLRKKLLLPGQQYKLHLRERGRERVLGQQERPINILRRRLEQAGYDESDNLEHLGGDDLGFLLQFVFRDANLTSAQASGEDDVLSSSSSLENIDLTGRGLLTIPIALHRYTSTIVILNLSKNPHIDIPLDFIAACTTLRDLRLSHAAMKQVPSRVKHISTLHELDISCNRMVSLDEADLHKIPNLRNVQAQNNRLATLPSWFPEMKGLKFLNISNNKFDVIPPVLCQLSNLLELDLSFNTISVFPSELGALVNLQRLVIVGNRIGSIPPEVANMASLKELDCRRNALTDLSTVFRCNSLEVLRAENNLLHGVALSAGSKIRVLCVSGNERLSSFQVETRGEGAPPYILETLELSKCMLSSLGDASLDQLGRLQSLKFDHNIIRVIPDAVCNLHRLEYLSGSNNQLDALPTDIGRLTELRSLHMHNNNIKVIPASIWQCGSLSDFNASSNLIERWLDPVEELSPTDDGDRKTSGGGGSAHGRPVPPLATCLENLYLADNRLEDDIFHSLSILRSLKVLNLAFNDIYELPPLRLQTFAQLRELYLSGNKLTSLPGEDLHRLYHLRILFLNANKLQTLPSELTKVKTLEVLDVGNNVLKYNVSNWQFDWNWNFNRELRYLNLSGNKRLEIKNAVSGHDTTRAGRAPLTDFSELTHMKMLGLMDVTLSVNPSIPDETEERRVRTSPSDINRMAYGIADTLGMFDNVDKPNSLKLSMFDLVVPSFRGRENECLLGMFGRHVPLRNGNRPMSNRLTRYLQMKFTKTFTDALKNVKPELGETVPDALRRAFLALNKGFYESLKTQEVTGPRKGSTTQMMPPTAAASGELRSAASGLVLYIVDEPDQRMMYVANVGNILAVVSRKQASPVQISTSHDPFDRNETARIRAAEGWVSPKGTVNDELDISRSFGVFHLLPAVNARPDVATVPLTDQDEFVIIGNRGLWDYVSPQIAVDIARLSKGDPMVAAQRLRDYAVSYGAKGSTMIMVIAVEDLFKPRDRQPTMDVDMDLQRMAPRRPEHLVGDRTLARLGREVPAPVGHIALVFTDIRNSTSLWEKNPGMPNAMKLHNSLLRRQLRVVGGYEVKTEGDAFMVSFPTVATALLWCFNVQVQLLQEEWPLWILESEEGKEVVDTDGNVLARGLSVRMGIHWGAPNCEPDHVTGRMDYLGTVVNRAARISGAAKGGQIMVSNDVVREIAALIPMDDSKPGILTSVDNVACYESNQTAEALQRMGVIVKEVGEARLKGLEVPEMLSLVYPRELVGRLKLLETEETPENASAAAAASRVQFSVEQIRSLAMLTIRIEALASNRVFRSTSTFSRNLSIQSNTGADAPIDEADHSVFMYANPELLLPTIKDNATDADLLYLMDSLSLRIENALASMYLQKVGGYHQVLAALEQATKVDAGMLVQALSMFGSLLEV